jgi:hypothetical protein
MQSWDWTLAEIGYPRLMICHELQAFKIRGWFEVAGHRLSHCAETGIPIPSLQALLMENG